MSEPAAPLSGGRRRLSPDSKTGGACEGIAASRSGLAERRTLIPGRRRPSIPAGRASVPMESRGRAWGVSPGLSGDAESANPSSVPPGLFRSPQCPPSEAQRRLGRARGLKYGDSCPSSRWVASAPNGSARRVGAPAQTLREGQGRRTRLPSPYERRLGRSATGSRRVGGSADRADLLFLQFSSASGPADPETRSDPKPSG